MIDKDITSRIDAITKQAKRLMLNGDFDASIEEYKKGLAMLSAPANQSRFAVMLYSGIGEAFYLQQKWADALAYYGNAVMSKGGLGEPLIHLRLGQIRFELGDTEKAIDELMRAYMGGGEFIFEHEDTKYFDLVLPTISNHNAQ
jgi:tetratricopeptide (TPR) repeat protein